MIVSFASPLSYFTELRPLPLDVSGGRHRPRPVDGHRAAAETISGKYFCVSLFNDKGQLKNSIAFNIHRVNVLKLTIIKLSWLTFSL